MDPVLHSWLDSEFTSSSTKSVYGSAVRRFQKVNHIENLKEYLKKPEEEIVKDIKVFLASMNGVTPTKTIKTYATGLRVFLRDNGKEIDNLTWRKLKRRNHMPKRVVASTRDVIPTKEEFREILKHMDLKGKSLFLFMISSGTRISETLRLKIEDLNLNSDPPEAFIRGENTKSGLGQRYVFFSYETRDQIEKWLEIKDRIGEKVKGSHQDKYDPELVWSMHPVTARKIFNEAVKRAGLSKRDVRTNRNVLHIHSLRKFFRSRIGLDVDMVHALMGRLMYLDESYLRLHKREIGEAYLRCMQNITIYENKYENAEAIKQLRMELDGLRTENEALRQELRDLEAKMIDERREILLKLLEKLGTGESVRLRKKGDKLEIN